MSTLSNFVKLLQNNTIVSGKVSSSLTGMLAAPVYFAALDAKYQVNSLGMMLQREDVIRDDYQEGDSEYNRKAYSLCVTSPWFPLATGTSPTLALDNLIRKINQPWIDETYHLLPLLSEKVIKRWVKRALEDEGTGEYTFHIDMKNVVPENEKGLV